MVRYVYWGNYSSQSSVTATFLGRFMYDVGRTSCQRLRCRYGVESTLKHPRIFQTKSFKTNLGSRAWISLCVFSLGYFFLSYFSCLELLFSCESSFLGELFLLKAHADMQTCRHERIKHRHSQRMKQTSHLKLSKDEGEGRSTSCYDVMKNYRFGVRR